MSILLSHFTALNAMRRWELQGNFSAFAPRDAEIPLARPTPLEVENAFRRTPFLQDAPRPIHLTTGGTRSKSRKLVVHQTKASSLPGALVNLGDGLLCTGPELLVLQLERYLTDLELMTLLMELTGVYAIGQTFERGFFTRRDPLTTPDHIRTFLDDMGRAPGVGRIRKVLERTCPNAASPRETKLFLRLTLPPRMGGYHLKVMAMNQPLKVKRIYDAKHEGIRKPDLLLLPQPKHKDRALHRGVIIEYDGFDHYNRSRHTTDSIRRSELQALGYLEYVVNAEQYRSLPYMDGLVAQVRKDLGMPREMVSREERRRRSEARRQLYIELEQIDGIHWTNGEEAGGLSRITAC